MSSSPVYGVVADFLGIVLPGSSTVYSAIADPVPGGRPASSPIYDGLAPASLDNAITFGQILVVEVVKALGNTLTFGQSLNLELLINVGNTITFDQDVISNTFFEEPSNLLTFGQKLNLEYNISVGNIITFQSLVEDAAKQEAPSNELTFGQVLGVVKVINVSVGNQITFGQLAFVKDFNFALDNELTFGQIVKPNVVLNIAIGNVIRFSVGVKKVTEAVAGNLITFNGTVARGEDPSNAIVFGQIVIVEVTSKADNKITFNQILAAQVILNIAVGNQITFGNRVQGVNVDNCDLQEYNPAGSEFSLVPLTSPVTVSAFSVKFECAGSPDLILRNPILSNTAGLDLDRVYARSRGGTLGSFRDQTWPKDRILTVTFNTLKIAKRDEVETFLKFCLGKLITYTDMETRIWEGIIVNPTTAIGQEAVNRFNLTIEMSGTPQ